MTGLTLYQPGVNEISLDVIREIVGHPSIQPSNPNGASNGSASEQNPQEKQLYSTSILQVLEASGYDMISLLLAGLVSHFPSDTLALVIMTLRCLCLALPAQQIQIWLKTAVESLSTSNVGNQDKLVFLENIQKGIASASRDEIKAAVTKLYQASRKARERARLDDGALDR